MKRLKLQKLPSTQQYQSRISVCNF